MLCRCPACGVRLRLPGSVQEPRLLTIRCPRCRDRVKIDHSARGLPQVLIVHEDPAICQQIIACINQLNIPLRCTACPHRSQLSRFLDQGDCLLLLDVAHAGGFPFGLIEMVRQHNLGAQHRIVLLPSVYNKTAYKKTPTSLYGADAYLELHHLEDRLLPLLFEQFPQLQMPRSWKRGYASCHREPDLPALGIRQRALVLARRLVADIALYYEDRLYQGISLEDAGLAMAACLDEGRRLLNERLPETLPFDDDFIGLAFCEFYQAHTQHQLRERP